MKVEAEITFGLVTLLFAGLHIIQHRRLDRIEAWISIVMRGRPWGKTRDDM